MTEYEEEENFRLANKSKTREDRIHALPTYRLIITILSKTKISL